MTAQSRIVDTKGRTRRSPAVIFGFLLLCLVFSGALYALPTAEMVAAPEYTPLEINAELDAVLAANTKCLKCHSREKFKLLGNGEELALRVPPDEFRQSAHGGIGCVGCHEAIGARKHPSKKTNIAIDNQREYSLELNQVCRNCHDKKFNQYEGSLHASLVAQGSDIAPVCSDCHNAHAVETMLVYQPVTGLPCKKCHESVFEAYSTSVHGVARQNGNVIRDAHIQAPICSDCHQAHDVTAVASTDRVRSACIGCHEGIELVHSDWLPNSGLHLEVVSCAACHAPVVERRVELELYDNLAQLPVGQHEDEALFQQRLLSIENADGSLDPMGLWNLVRESAQQGQSTDVTLRGRLEVSSGVEAHRLSTSGSAVRQCESCHQAGSAAFENVVVSISRPDGRKLHYAAEKETLNSLTSVDSVGGFYALGGTRIKLLDGLLMLSLVAGLAVPIGHFSMGRLMRRKKGKGEQ